MIEVDISNIWGQLSLRNLLAMEKEVFDAHMALTDGTGRGSDYMGWQKLPVREPSAEHQRIQKAAQKIRSDSEVCVVLGIGGSSQGARAVIELLQGPHRNLTRGKGDPQILFAGNSFSTRQWNELTRLLEGKDVSVIVISKSGTTLEPAIAFRGLRWLLERKYGTDEAKKRIYAVTDPCSGALRRMAEEEGWETFSIPVSTGGRFSVLTAAGLLPMAVAGIDIMAVLSGTAEAKECYDLRSFENPVWLYAAVRNLLYRSGKKIELFASNEPAFHQFGSWWQQIFAQSEGKDGKGLFPVRAEFTADLHALGQMIQSGERNLFETILRFDAPEQSVTIGGDWKNLDGLNYLEGKELSFVSDCACQGALEAHADGDVPVISITCGELSEAKVGELIWFLELSCVLSAYILGVDPMNQSGAGMYKRNMYSLLGKPGYESV